MSKLKKVIAGALAAVICATSVAAQAPATADAATYCSHNIYKAGRIEVGSYDTQCTVYEDLLQWRTYERLGWLYTEYYTIKVPKTYTCTVKSYRDVYACYKCNYSYLGGTYSSTSHSH